MPHIPRIHTHRDAHGPCWCTSVVPEKADAACLRKAAEILKPLAPVPMQLRAFRLLVQDHDAWFFMDKGEDRDALAATWREAFQKAQPLVAQAMMKAMEYGLHKAAFESH